MISVWCKLKDTPEQGEKFIPTSAQMLSCFILSYWATKMYLPIFVVRIDEHTGDLFFLAGEETEVSIKPDGEWRFET